MRTTRQITTSHMVTVRFDNIEAAARAAYETNSEGTESSDWISLGSASKERWRRVAYAVLREVDVR